MAITLDEDIEEHEKVDLEMEDIIEDSSDSQSSVEHSGSEAGSETERSSTNTNDSKEQKAPDLETPAKSGPSVEDLRKRLAEKIQTLRAQRKAPGTGMPGAPLNRDAILKARKVKDQARKESLKRKREAEGEIKNEPTDSSSTKDAVTPAKSTETDSTEIMFTKVSLKTGEAVLTNGEIQPKKRKKGPVDLLGQLKHVEAKKARIASMDKDKRETIEQKEKWKRAIKQAEGEKVKDDDNLLKKSLKKLQKRKKKSAREWKEREENVAKGIKARQKKREENIAARREQKKKGKLSKSSKGKQTKKKQRPGFEGGSKGRKA